jgi:DNA polymerase-1
MDCITDRVTLIDSPYLCFRSFFALKNIGKDGEIPTNQIIGGFLTQLLSLVSADFSTNFVFCWDSKKSLRKQIYPEYKAGRHKDKTPEAEAQYQSLYYQMNVLRQDVLPRIGFKNVFMQTGLESDDLIAKIILDDNGEEYGSRAVYSIVSSDEDLYQVLDRNVLIRDPWTKKSMSESLFVRDYGIPAKKWAFVKALAGCISDNVKGIDGIGEKTAIRYLKGEDIPGVKGELLKEQAGIIVKKNLPIVKLPHPKTVSMEIVPNEFSFENLVVVMKEHGLKEMLKRDASQWKRICQ